jgi:hypothetical protein
MKKTITTSQLKNLIKNETKKILNEKYEGEFDLSYLPEMVTDIAAEGINTKLQKELNSQYNNKFKFDGSSNIVGNTLYFYIQTPKGEKIKIKGTFSLSK